MAAGGLQFYPLWGSYIAVFGLTAIVCFSVIPRALAQIEGDDARTGLTALLALSGFWAAFQVGRLVVPLSSLKVTFYVLGLTVGLATVGAWLYFCSAYVGASYHREPLLRVLAVAIYSIIMIVKFTSPVHGLYFSTALATTPFPHLEIRFRILHWIVTGLAYALSAIGFYMLFNLFRESNYATNRLVGLVGLAALPVLFDLVGYASPGTIITLYYEPIGVGLFAVGVLYVADGSFLAVRRFGREQLLDEINEGVVVLDTDGLIRDVNNRAEGAFPTLESGIGRSLPETAPGLAAHLPVEEPEILTFEEGDSSQYYILTTRDLTVGQTPIGQALLFTDITEVEEQRRAVEQQQQQFDAFAEAITHELRNTLTIVQGYLDLAATQVDSEADDEIVETISTITKNADRMAGIVSDLTTLAQFGRPVETTSSVEVAPVARQAWDSMEPAQSELVIVDGGRIEAHDIRLERLLRNLFEFAIANGATSVQLAQNDGRVVMTDDGGAIAETAVEAAFEYGAPVPSAESGMLLPVVRTLAEAHGWTVTIDTDYEDGVRVVIKL